MISHLDFMVYAVIASSYEHLINGQLLLSNVLWSQLYSQINIQCAKFNKGPFYVHLQFLQSMLAQMYIIY